jgi:hypothetical protein
VIFSIFYNFYNLLPFFKLFFKKISKIIFALKLQYDIIEIKLGKESLNQKRRIHMAVKRKKATKKKATKRKAAKRK